MSKEHSWVILKQVVLQNKQDSNFRLHEVTQRAVIKQIAKPRAQSF